MSAVYLELRDDISARAAVRTLSAAAKEVGSAGDCEYDPRADRHDVSHKTWEQLTNEQRELFLCAAIDLNAADAMHSEATRSAPPRETLSNISPGCSDHPLKEN